jgi:hypothetical protein
MLDRTVEEFRRLRAVGRERQVAGVALHPRFSHHPSAFRCALSNTVRGGLLKAVSRRRFIVIVVQHNGDK